MKSKKSNNIDEILKNAKHNGDMHLELEVNNLESKSKDAPLILKVKSAEAVELIMEVKEPSERAEYLRNVFGYTKVNGKYEISSNLLKKREKSFSKLPNEVKEAIFTAAKDCKINIPMQLNQTAAKIATTNRESNTQILDLDKALKKAIKDEDVMALNHLMLGGGKLSDYDPYHQDRIKVSQKATELLSQTNDGRICEALINNWGAYINGFIHTKNDKKVEVEPPLYKTKDPRMAALLLPYAIRNFNEDYVQIKAGGSEHLEKVFKGLKNGFQLATISGISREDSTKLAKHIKGILRDGLREEGTHVDRTAKQRLADLYQDFATVIGIKTGRKKAQEFFATKFATGKQENLADKISSSLRNASAKHRGSQVTPAYIKPNKQATKKQGFTR